MIQSGAKITVDNTDEGTLIAIYPEMLPWQTVALGAWVVVWMLSGVLGFLGMLKEAQGDQYVFMLIFMAFWVYFLFYGLRSFIWHRIGREFIRITKDSLDYKRGWGDYGRAVSYDLETIKNVGLVDYSQKTFARTYQDAFWTIGGGQIGFDYMGRKVVIGMRLPEKEAKNIIRQIEKARKAT